MNKQFILSKEQKKIIDKDGFIIFPPNNFVLKNLKKIHKILENLITKEKSKAGWEGKEEYYKKQFRFFDQNLCNVSCLI